MVVPSLKRSLAAATLGLSLLLTGLLSACGDDGGSAESTANIQPSTYSTIVSTTAAAAPASGGAPAGGTVSGTQVYEVQSGDFLGGIAEDFDIPPESIANFNQWEDGVNHMLHPDMVINIPPGAAVPSADDSDDDEEESGSGDEEESDTTEEDGDAQEEVDPDDPPNCPNGDPQGTYTIAAGDIPFSVAESLDVTPDQLDEANANTPGYRNFVVGIEILVPCGAEDE